MTNHDVERFNRRAQTYDRDLAARYYHAPLRSALVELMVTKAEHPQRILDVGCGTGRLAAALAAHFLAAEVIGIDPAPNMVRVAASAGSGEQRPLFAVGAAESLPFADNSFDLIVSSDSFHHWMDQRQGLHEIQRVMTPDGLVIMEDPFSIGWNKPLALLNERHRTHNGMEKLLHENQLIVKDWHTILRFGLPCIQAVIFTKA